MAINKTIVQGRLTRDPELRHTQSGKAVASFTVAWSETYNGTENKLFLPCVCWDKNGEFVSKHFGKGQELVAEGRLGTRSWKDKDGHNRETVEMTVDRVHFCGPKAEGTAKPAGAPVTVTADFRELVDEDGEELPF